MKLEVSGIHKQFHNHKKTVKVLSDVSLVVEEGQFVTLLGPSGCGKTTLLTIIAGFQHANGGTVSLNGQVVTAPGPDRGFVFQNYALFPWMTVRDNILFPMKQLKMPKEAMEERLDHLLTISQLTGKEHHYPHQISGGMKQRVAMIRALASKPQVLLMDEPMGAVDFQMRQLLQEELETMWLKDKTTVVMVTHDVEEAVFLSDRVIVMSDQEGKILSDVSLSMPRSRDRGSAEYNEAKQELTALLKIALTKNNKEI